MPICTTCRESFPARTVLDGKEVHLDRRKRCLACSPRHTIQTSGSKNGKAVVDWRRRTKIKAVAYKGGACLICGYNRCVRSLAFHHLDPAKKDFSIAGKCLAWDTIRAEIDKCVLLCGNCHDEVHDGITDLEPYLSRNTSPSEGDFALQQSGLVQIKVDPTCPSCGIEVRVKGHACLQCARKAREHIQWPAPDSLRAMVAGSNFEAVGRQLGVSGNSVRKRVRNHF